MIMLRRIKTELTITISLDDPQKSYQKKDTWQGQCDNFIRTWKKEFTLKLGKRCLNSLETSNFTEPPTKNKFRQAGAGRKKSVPEVREAMYDWFIDIRSSLKARLPKSMFKASCKIFYEQWLSQQEKEVPEEKKIVFSNKWIRGWMQEYNVSLRKPNKRFQIEQAEREERIFEYLKNIWTVRKLFTDNFGVDHQWVSNAPSSQRECIPKNSKFYWVGYLC